VAFRDVTRHYFLWLGYVSQGFAWLDSVRQDSVSQAFDLSRMCASQANVNTEPLTD
jgi:hypothetical protein